MIYILILNLLLSLVIPIFLIRSGLDKSDATPVLILLNFGLFMYSVILLSSRKYIKKTKSVSLLTVVLAIGVVCFSYFHLKNNLFTTDTDKRNYSSVVEQSKGMWPEILEHMPVVLPTGECFYLLQSTFDISKIQLSAFVSEEECQEIYNKAKLSAIYSQKGFDLSKSNQLWSIMFRSFDNSEFINLNDDYEVFVLYVSEESEEPIENWQNIYCNSGVAINNSRNLVVFWALYPY